MQNFEDGWCPYWYSYPTPAGSRSTVNPRYSATVGDRNLRRYIGVWLHISERRLCVLRAPVVWSVSGCACGCVKFDGLTAATVYVDWSRFKVKVRQSAETSGNTHQKHGWHWHINDSVSVDDIPAWHMDSREEVHSLLNLVWLTSDHVSQCDDVDKDIVCQSDPMNQEIQNTKNET